MKILLSVIFKVFVINYVNDQKSYMSRKHHLIRNIYFFKNKNICMLISLKFNYIFYQIKKLLFKIIKLIYIFASF